MHPRRRALRRRHRRDVRSGDGMRRVSRRSARAARARRHRRRERCRGERSLCDPARLYPGSRVVKVREGRVALHQDHDMKSDPESVRILNDLLTNELTAINQYFIHAKLCDHWGFKQLGEKIRAESIDEMKHADVVIERILFLDGVPNLQKLNKLHVGETVKEALESDLQLEYAAIKFLNDSIEILRGLGDHGSDELLRKILVGEEEHADWLETQLEAIKTIGEPNYLAQKL